MPQREESFVASESSASARPSIDCSVLPSQTTPAPLVLRARTFAVLALLCAVAAAVGLRFANSLQGTDFPDFYCAARMLADGRGNQLYNSEVQRQYQARYAGRVGTLYIHPPFEAVLYLAVAWLPLRRGYLLWSFLNLALMAIAARHLSKEVLFPWDWHFLAAAALTFAPLLLCCIQGQDSMLLLLLLVLAFTALRRGRAFAAGCWFGLGLFKFQFILPVVLVLVLTQSKTARNALARGFILVALALAGLSAAICGWPVFAAYPKFLAHLPQEPFAGIVPLAMANFRGLTYFFLDRNQSPWAVAVVVILCVAALIKTLIDWKRAQLSSNRSPSTSSDEFDLAFTSTVLFGLLVSYHLNPHDLTLSLLPISLLLHLHLKQKSGLAGTSNWIPIGLLAILFLPPLHLWALRTGSYATVGLALLSLFLVAVPIARKDIALQAGQPCARPPV